LFHTSHLSTFETHPPWPAPSILIPDPAYSILLDETSIHIMDVCSLYPPSTEILYDLLFAAVDETLRKLEPTRMDISTRPECLAGTREDLLETIGKWVFLGPERVFWLHGLAGSGKSTISTAIATFFQEQKRLGAFVFCNRDSSL
jgi:hypothetical protein